MACRHALARRGGLALIMVDTYYIVELYFPTLYVRCQKMGDVVSPCFTMTVRPFWGPKGIVPCRNVNEMEKLCHFMPIHMELFRCFWRTRRFGMRYFIKNE